MTICDGVSCYDGVSYDGNSALFLNDNDSAFIYLPDFGLNELQKSLENLQLALDSSLAESRLGILSSSHVQSGPGKREQWVCVPKDRALGWPGPSRWQKCSWQLSENESPVGMQLIVAIRDQVESIVANLVEDAIDRIAHATSIRLSEQYNACLVNRYLNGRAAIKWHSDEEKWYYVPESTPELESGKDITNPESGTSGTRGTIKYREDMVIASVSLGAERWFEVRQKKPKSCKSNGFPLEETLEETKTTSLINRAVFDEAESKACHSMPRHAESDEALKVDSSTGNQGVGEHTMNGIPTSFRILLKSGSLLIMAGKGAQKRWEHRIPVDSSEEVRLNLTFRRVMTAAESPILAQPKKQKKFKPAQGPGEETFTLA